MKVVTIDSRNTAFSAMRLKVNCSQQTSNEERIIPMEIPYEESGIVRPIISLEKEHFTDCAVSTSYDSRSALPRFIVCIGYAGRRHNRY